MRTSGMARGLMASLLLAWLPTSQAACPLSALPMQRLWSGDLADWSRSAQGALMQFGAVNLQRTPGGLRAVYPRGSYDPAAVRTAGALLGGAQFKTPFERMQIASGEEIGIRYRVTPDENFEFMRGGKLPGLYGGAANSGGRVPNGSDGFSLRFVWQAQGQGALSVYLPTSGRWGTVFGLGQWRFRPALTTELALYVRLNTPGRADGVIAAWADDALVVYAHDVLFRTDARLGLDGFYFSSFFGGSTPDWATPVDTGNRFDHLDVFRLQLPDLARCASAQPGVQARHEMN